MPLLAFQRGPPVAEEGYEVLTRGPVHEAFAETISFDPEPGIVAAKEPPEAIEELPPEQRPEGANVAWIPGYWAWDDERDDFLWISGIWRDLPPGRQWVPGYWSESRMGFQWISGYWADATAREIQYLPEPPQSVENGPNTDAPSINHTWLPGCWIWQQTRYAWRPGYWETAQPNWVWVPSYYVWAPRGYLFVDGYWDHSINRRGVLFAPIHFQANIYSRRGFTYSPASVINPAVFTSHLFVRPGYGHYYYGDFYAASYTRAGFMPGFSLHSGRHGYDPLYAHLRWENRQDRNWERERQENFNRLREDEHSRPPRSWSEQRQRGGDPKDQNHFMVAAPLEQVLKSKDSPLRFQALDQAERQRVAQNGREVQKFRRERQELEQHVTARAPADRAGDAVQPERVKFPTSPILARTRSEQGRENSPPKSHTAPMTDAQYQPKPRTARPVDRARSRQPRESDPSMKLGSDRQPTVRGEQPSTGKSKSSREDSDRPRPPNSPLTTKPGADDPQPRPRPGRTESPQKGKSPMKADPQPRNDKPMPRTEPQPRGEKPMPRTEPQPRNEKPAPKPQTVQKSVVPARNEQPVPRAQPQPRNDKPMPRTEPQPRGEKPKLQPKAPKADRPMVQPGKPGSNPGGQAGPAPGGPNKPAKDREQKPKKD